eukprot:UC4_evm3s1315
MTNRRLSLTAIKYIVHQECLAMNRTEGLVPETLRVSIDLSVDATHIFCVYAYMTSESTTFRDINTENQNNDVEYSSTAPKRRQQSCNSANPFLDIRLNIDSDSDDDVKSKSYDNYGEIVSFYSNDEEENLFELSDDPARDAERIDRWIEIQEEIRQHLIDEEQRMIEEQKEEREKELELQSLMEDLDVQDLLETSNEIVCPLCMKNTWLQRNNIIFCSCGMRIDTEFDGVTLVSAKERLDEAVNEHSSSCIEVPEFTLIKPPCKIPGIDHMVNLVMKCSKCDAFEFII